EYYSLREQQDDESLIIGEAQEDIMAEHVRFIEENADTIKRQIDALNQRERMIEAGTWPCSAHGRPLPMNMETLTPEESNE
ncbi:hypothetical protein M3M33_16000, partial [Loigolactobacillus coryniformis]|uniref:hypothetical protein n=1 Tax=Loigolactobacillus coryniformis TaxID=1610 RepID=UPI00201B0EF6